MISYATLCPIILLSFSLGAISLRLFYHFYIENKEVKGIRLDSDILKAIQEFDESQRVEYLKRELLKIGFIEYKDCCFIYGEYFKILFSVDWKRNDIAIPEMQVVYRPLNENNERGPERKYMDLISLVSITQVAQAYTKLTGEPL